jgi:hypothetical protein
MFLKCDARTNALAEMKYHVALHLSFKTFGDSQALGPTYFNILSEYIRYAI